MVGGSYPNVPCLPSKNIIHSAKVASFASRAEAFGVRAASVAIDMPAVQRRKRSMVEDLVKVHVSRYEASGVELIMGDARFVAPKTGHQSQPWRHANRDERMDHFEPRSRLRSRAAMTVGGNLGRSTRVLTTAIVDPTSRGQIQRALALGIILLLLSLLVNLTLTATPARSTSLMDIEIERLRFQRAGRVVLEIPSLRLHANRTTAILGPNGAGKTTLLRLIAALELRNKGSSEWEESGSSRYPNAAEHRSRFPGASVSPTVPPREFGPRTAAPRASTPAREASAWRKLRLFSVSGTSSTAVRNRLSAGEGRRANLARLCACTHRSSCSMSRLQGSTPRPIRVCSTSCRSCFEPSGRRPCS